MNGDIRPPRRPKTNRPKPAPAPKPEPHGLDSDMPLPDINIDLPDDPKPKRLKFKFFHKFINYLPIEKWYQLSRRQKIIVTTAALIVLIGLIFAVDKIFFKPAPKIPERRNIKTAAVSKTVPSPLTGLPVDPALAKRPVTAIMVENSLNARPQSGLQDAGVVFEAIAEAGITRFMAIYQDAEPQYIGPVRSLRPYYLDFATPFQASVAHVGGSPDALAQIRSSGSGVTDLDQFFNSGAYWRQSNRDAPHNVYTSFANLDQLNQSKGHLESSYVSWPRKKDSPMRSPSAKTIDLAISGPDYNVRYDWDAPSNTYQRSEGGKPHIVTTSADNATGQQLHPKVVIALVTNLVNGELDASGAYYSDYTVSGNGQAYIFQDGGVTQGNWSKEGRGGQFTFTDNSGNAIKLNAGQTWITLVQSGQVSYTP